MPDDTRQFALAYLQAPKDSFWMWADRQTIVWRDGWTIAFREEIECSLRAVGDRAVLPMGAIVLVLAACRPTWLQANGGRHSLVQFAEPKLSADHHQQLFAKVLKGLDAIHAMPAPLRTGADAKAAIIRALCEHHVDPLRVSPQIAEMLSEGIAGLTLSQAGGSEHDFDRVLTALAEVMSKFNPQSLELLNQTGLEATPEPAPIDEMPDLPACVRVRQLIDTLKTDEELASLMKVAREVIAAIQLPRPVSAPDQLSTGGVSDITNRGTIDRLLTSELAHDGETLAVRVALGEALYLRREFFPEVPESHRYVLLDSGIRLWGVPRVFAAAVALAMGATTHQKDQLHVFRAADEGLEKIDLATRSGLISHLAALEALPHPGASLAPFFTEARSSGMAVEAILITHLDTLADPDFQSSLAALENDLLYVAAVDSEGNLQLLQVHKTGRRIIKEAVLKLDDLFELRANQPQISLRPPSSDLPAIFGEAIFPLLMPERIDRPWRSDHSQFGSVSVANNRLIHWRHKMKGARRLVELPEKNILHLSINPEGVVRMLIDPCTNAAPLKYVTYDLSTDEHRVIELGRSIYGYMPVWIDREAICLIDRRVARAYSTVSGAELVSLEVNAFSAPQTFGRCFLRSDGWYAASFTNEYSKPTFKFDGLVARGANLVNVFETANHAGLALYDDGTLSPIQSYGRAAKIALGRLPRITRLAAVSHDNDRIAVECTDQDRREVVFFDLQTSQTSTSRVKWEKAWVDYLRPAYPTRTLQHRFVGAGFVHSNLVLFGVRGTRWVFMLNDQLEEIYLRESTLTSKIHGFQPVQSPSVPRPVALRAAHFADGSRIFLDSRGLLHLVSSDQSVPELTIALTHMTACAGWISDGRTFGDPYFHGSIPTASAAEAHDILQQFVRRLR